MAPGLWTLVDAGLSLLAVGISLSLRPWRALGRHGPSWAWVTTCATMPLLWCSANLVGVPSVPTFSLAPLLVLMAGWPLAVLALIPVTLVTALAGQLSFGDALHRLTWLGIVPAALMLALGAASRRWLPNHILVYIFSRGFFGILVATLVAGISMMWTQGQQVAPDTASYVARLLVSLSEALTCGLVTAGLVAFRPGILSTYTDRLYLPR